MFDNIAPKYDFLNHFLSFGIDKVWRRKAIRLLMKYSPVSILDVATGTGDFAIAALKTGATKIIGVDISEEMLAVGRVKIENLGIASRITLEKGDSEELSFPDNSFDAVTVAFGVRNFENTEIGLREMHRVLQPGGKLLVLEFMRPQSPLVQKGFAAFNLVLSPIGKAISGHPTAYSYLPQSVGGFYNRAEFAALLLKTGFGDVWKFEHGGGIATSFLARKSCL